MIELTDDFLDKLADVARAHFGMTFDRQTNEGMEQLRHFAKSLLAAPDDERTITVFNHIEKHLERPVATKVIHPGFKPKIDHDFFLAEEGNYFRSGKPSPDAEAETPDFTP